MENPPPVPPKDARYLPRMDVEYTPHERPSSSKRKREVHDDNIYELHDGHLDPDAYTPKRSRSHPQPSDGYNSDDQTPMQQREIRRKKGSRNLSHLNLRHAAERQDHEEAQRVASKESKFVEGSLTDKPSQKPPSAFTRFIRTDSGNLQYVDELMADYHNGMPTPRASADIAIAKEKAEIPGRVAAISARYEPTEENKGFLFRFGRQLAASFHPVKMWKQVWDESAEELRQKAQLDMEKKRMSKEEAERRYAEMKMNGQFAPKHVQHVSAGEDIVTPRDSGVAMSSARPTLELTRPLTNESNSQPQGSSANLPRTESNNQIQCEENNSPDELEPPETGHKVIRSIRSRLNFKRPSLSNLRIDLKRPKSEFNLAAAANRDSSSSVSPVKAELDASTLKQSASKVDLKKQYKLSKRVSDLEVKLQHARTELNQALVQASPMPKMNGKYERFQSPHSTLKRPKFAMASRLPSLPSERLLDPARMGFAPEELDSANETERERARSHAATVAALEGTEARNGIDLMDEGDDVAFDHTIKSFRSTPAPYPPRADSLFRLDKNPNIETLHTDQDTIAGANDSHYDNAQTDDMDIADNINVATEAQVVAEPEYVEQKKTNTCASLDAKLKALEASAKAARKPSKSKKRKSGDDEKAFKPDAEDADKDDDWERFGGKSKTKKRKSTDGKTESKSSPNATKKGKKGSTAQNTSPIAKRGSKVVAASDPITVPELPAEPVHTTELFQEKDAATAQARTSIDEQSLASLEPVYEEDEEIAVSTTTANVPLNAEPAKATARATPARHSRARSASPTKHARSPGSEERLFTRAAEAAQKTRTAATNDTANSPPLGSKFIRANVGEANEGDGITVVPGQNGAPNLPKGAHGSFESLAELDGRNEVLDNENVDTSPRKGRSRSHGKRARSAAAGPKEGFEWPEDVF